MGHLLQLPPHLFNVNSFLLSGPDKAEDVLLQWADLAAHDETLRRGFVDVQRGQGRQPHPASGQYM